MPKGKFIVCAVNDLGDVKLLLNYPCGGERTFKAKANGTQVNQIISMFVAKKNVEALVQHEGTGSTNIPINPKIISLYVHV